MPTIVEMRKTKRCSRCGETKPRGEFGPRADGRDGLNPRCRACAAAESRADKARRTAGGLCRDCGTNPTPGRARCADCARRAAERRRQRQYNLTPAEWQAKLEAQGFACANPGCGREPTCLDHDHIHDPRDPAGHRGLLCRGCNVALGNTADSPRRARGLATYLERYAAHTETA